MDRSGFVITVAVATGLTLGCRGPSPDELPEMLGVEGCLTASGDELVLTQLTPSGTASQTDGPAAATAPGVPAPQATRMFTLTGMEDELRPHVGQQVRVRGEAHAPEVAVVQQHETPAPSDPSGAASSPGAAGSTGDQARVTTMQQTRLESTEMVVRAVTPLNRTCQTP